LKILVDMNLSPEWVDVLCENGIPAVHWSDVGDPCAPDTRIMAWARANNHVVFTHDLDFGSLLHTTSAKKPSVIQIRAEDVRPSSSGHLVLSALHQASDDLLTGALVTINPRKMRISILPMKS
jgi:predicted nuclease of predicted toxin-antitoxin system